MLSFLLVREGYGVEGLARNECQIAGCAAKLSTEGVEVTIQNGKLEPTPVIRLGQARWWGSTTGMGPGEHLLQLLLGL